MLDIKYTIERILRRSRRTIIKYLPNPNPSSYPFISGDTFRAISDHIYEEINFKKFNPEKIKKKDIIFVQSFMIEQFFNEAHPKIKEKYILITHNGDENITEKYLKYIDDKIVHWFAQNLLTKNQKITAIPIGLENADYSNAGRLFLYRNYLKYRKEKRNGRILSAFNVVTNKTSRSIALDNLKNNPNVDFLNKKITQKNYINLLRKYSYVASPPGNGHDCHRTWEALYIGTIPIVEKSIMTEEFKKMGFPLKIIDSWDKIDLSEQDNIEFDNKIILFDYWKDKILDKKNKC